MPSDSPALARESLLPVPSPERRAGTARTRGARPWAPGLIARVVFLSLALALCGCQVASAPPRAGNSSPSPEPEQRTRAPTSAPSDDGELTVAVVGVLCRPFAVKLETPAVQEAPAIGRSLSERFSDAIDASTVFVRDGGGRFLLRPIVMEYRATRAGDHKTYSVALSCALIRVGDQRTEFAAKGSGAASTADVGANARTDAEAAAIADLVDALEREASRLR